MLLRESMGVSADGSNKAFASADIDRLLDRPRQAIPIDTHMPQGWSAFGTSHFILAVDPCGGGASAFAVTSMAQIHTGQLLVRTHSSIPSLSASACSHDMRTSTPPCLHIAYCAGITGHLVSTQLLLNPIPPPIHLLHYLIHRAVDRSRQAIVQLIVARGIMSRRPSVPTSTQHEIHIEYLVAGGAKGGDGYVVNGLLQVV